MGFDAKSLTLKRRDILGGGPAELLVAGIGAHRGKQETGDSDCELFVEGKSQHFWVCGVADHGDGLKPYCWIHAETSRTVRIDPDMSEMMPPEERKQAAGCEVESWSHAVTVKKGKVTLTGKGTQLTRDIRSLPCLRRELSAHFECEVRP